MHLGMRAKGYIPVVEEWHTLNTFKGYTGGTMGKVEYLVFRNCSFYPISPKAQWFSVETIKCTDDFGSSMVSVVGSCIC